MQQILSESNPLMYNYIHDSEEFIKEEVRMICSQEELQAICPEGITPPEIDFQNHCLIYAIAYSPVHNYEIKKVELFLLRTSPFLAVHCPKRMPGRFVK